MKFEDAEADDIPLTRDELRRLRDILPSLEKFVENKERIDWFWSTSKKWGGGTIGIIIIVSTFQEHAVKLWQVIKGFFLRGP